MHRRGMGEFQEWLKKKIANGDGGISCPKVELTPFDESMGYGLFATEDIRQNEVLIKIPEKFMITAQFVADIPEYTDILKIFRLDPAEILALFFAFEKVYFDNFDYTKVENVCVDEVPNFVDIINKRHMGIEQFLKTRNNRIFPDEKTTTDDDDILWWKAYIGVLPCSFGTPLFKHYLVENVYERIGWLAAQLPLQIKEKLMSQLAELKKFEAKLFDIVGLNENFAENLENELTNQLAETYLNENLATNKFHNIEKTQDLNSQKAFWREKACWAWHVVNTRCIFVDNLPFHPLVDSEKENDKSKRLGKRRFSTKKVKRGEANDYGGSLALVPLIDMLNHKPDAQCIPMLDKTSNSYIVRAEQHVIMAGQQLFVCYGAHDNARLWIEYGFRMDENPFNRVNIPIELFIALSEKCGTRVSSTKREILAKADLPFTIYATDDFPSYALRKNCSILLLPKEKLANWSQYIWDWEGGDEFNEGGERQILQAILRRLEFALIARREESAVEEVHPFWNDQIQILQKMFENLNVE